VSEGLQQCRDMDRGWRVLLGLLLLLGGGGAGEDSTEAGHYTHEAREAEFQKLWQEVEDKVGLEAIRSLHKQLDDDGDGWIEPSETGDFIKADLKLHAPPSTTSDRLPALQYGEEGSARERLFHRKDAEITVPDLWATWVKSEVHNWTEQQTVAWLRESVDLPQYAEVFENHSVDGKQLPRAAAEPNFLNKVLGISNSIHRSKISLKAMDIVLFGPPKESSHWLKDLLLTSLLLALGTALVWAHRTKRLSEEKVNRMMKDFESLAKAEQALSEMQSKLEDKERQGKRQAGASEGGGGVGGQVLGGAHGPAALAPDDLRT